MAKVASFGLSGSLENESKNGGAIGMESDLKG